MRDHSRDYYDDKYIDGRYPSVKAPAQTFYEDDDWDDDETSWEPEETPAATYRDTDLWDDDDTRERRAHSRAMDVEESRRRRGIEVRGGDSAEDYYSGRKRTARGRAADEEDRKRRHPIQIRGGDSEEDYYDEDPRETDEYSWEVNRYMRSLPQRETTKRSVGSKEAAPEFDNSARAWRNDPNARLREEPVYEEAVLDDGPVMPLSIVLLVTAILLTAIAGFGRLHGYRSLDYDWRRAPLLSLVFSGWHEDISPIAALTQDAVTTVTDDAASESGDGTGADAVDGSGDGTAEGVNDATGDDTAEDGGADTTEQEPTVVDLNIPDGVNDAVVPAVDYGICNTAYLAASGTTFETLTDGIFAPNGTYLEPQTVDERYLNDVLFIGDSRTDGLHLYGNVKDAAYFWCKEALSVYDVFDAEAVYYVPGDANGESMTLESALGQASFRKIYVSIGINELGTPDTVRFYNQYKELISYLREQQPDALIYIQGIMHVSASYSQTDAAFNNTNIVEKNTAIASLANGRDIFYLDMNDKVCDTNGDLLTDLSNDGLHLKASAYAIWKEDILEHAFVRDAGDWAAPEETSTGSNDGTTGISGQGTGKPASDISETTGLIVQ